MPNIGIFYGSTSGNTCDVAMKIQAALGGQADEAIDIEGANANDLMGYDILVLGIPTWNVGEMQEDWISFSEEVAAFDWSGKKVALFGCGDQVGYPDTFGDALALLWEYLQPRGATLIGEWPTNGYEFEDSMSLKDGKFLGLLVDIENQEELTDDRVHAWVNQLKNEM